MTFSLAEGLAAEGCDALLVLAGSSRDPDLAPFVGPVHLGSSFVIAPRAGEPALGYLTPMERDEAAATGCRLLSPEELGVDELLREHRAEDELWAELLARGLAVCGLEPGRLALTGRVAAGVVVGACAELGERGWEFVDGRRLALLQRKCKGAEEQAAARHAAEGTCAAFRRVAAMLAAARIDGETLELEGGPLTVGRLRAAIARELAGFGLEQPEGNIVAGGAAGGVPHSVGNDGDLVGPGEMLVVDLFPRGRLFADCTRTFCVGEPSPAAAEAHALVLEALTAAHKALVPGVRGWDLQEKVCSIFEKAGHPTPRSHPGTQEGYVHGLGHGVGYEIHEYPSFRRRATEEGVIEAGDLVTLEPGLYYPGGSDGGFGVRLEDLLLVTDNGPLCLTPLPYEPDPLAWA